MRSPGGRRLGGRRPVGDVLRRTPDAIGPLLVCRGYAIGCWRGSRRKGMVGLGRRARVVPVPPCRPLGPRPSTRVRGRRVLCWAPKRVSGLSSAGAEGGARRTGMVTPPRRPPRSSPRHRIVGGGGILARSTHAAAPHAAVRAVGRAAVRAVGRTRRRRPATVHVRFCPRALPLAGPAGDARSPGWVSGTCCSMTFMISGARASASAGASASARADA